MVDQVQSRVAVVVVIGPEIGADYADSDRLLNAEVFSTSKVL